MNQTELVEFFSKIAKNNIIWGLQGIYQRTLNDLVDAGLLTKKFAVCYEKLETAEEVSRRTHFTDTELLNTLQRSKAGLIQLIQLLL